MQRPLKSPEAQNREGLKEGLSTLPGVRGMRAGELSIVMPCLNEIRTLGGCIKEAMQAMMDAGIHGEVVIADNGSADGSQELAASLGARVVDVAQRGYGSALRGGIAASRGEFVVMGDCDGSYDFGHAPRIVEKLQEGYDLVMGNRFLGGIQPGAMPWKHRYIGNPVLSGIGRLLFRCPAGDFHCGLRGFRRDVYDQLGLNTTGMEFASEMVIKAQLGGFKIAEVPTVLRPDGRDRAPHLRSFRDGWRHLRFMLLFSPRWLFFVPGCVLALIGLLLMAIVAIGSPARIGGVSLSVNTSIAASLLTLLGSQLAFTGLFARRLATRLGALPPSRSLGGWASRGSLEWGVVAGLMAVSVGLSLLAYATLRWRETGFAKLDPLLTMRFVVPAMTLMVLGTGLSFLSFLFGLVGLKVGSVDAESIDDSGSVLESVREASQA
ncbi:glycosyltransferase family 2 protein [Allorhodopirellula solitaria]|uniref:Undecaprenyl-phosphate 4-deoxy-4-formamido-L-arabinose transferase n=1 Tax=Allorhodopirellula solitaria TaxID=2527987 RepID=A0A5C5YKB4_9BACT|nr:glycosyltransferase family 2 protein [Allorhodopirellula solitaria]TWT75291.1 Undecaprenyl-phosphate 4-deoxy-4-formamido-L-arabinose transferase [Allorhodopirellula solitaria]